ncbi:MAG: hypothetical protein ACE5L6_03920 [Candidatus Bathyarchaeia archaeon]
MRIGIEKVRRILAAIVGTVQGTLGALAVAFSYFLHVNFLGLREILEVSEGVLPLYMLILIIFGFSSIIGGLFLLAEGLESL